MAPVYCITPHYIGCGRMPIPCPCVTHALLPRPRLLPALRAPLRRRPPINRRRKLRGASGRLRRPEQPPAVGPIAPPSPRTTPGERCTGGGARRHCIGGDGLSFSRSTDLSRSFQRSLFKVAPIGAENRH